MVGKNKDDEAKKSGGLGPSNCASRTRADDAANAVQDMAALMNGMDSEVVKRMVHARNAAAGVYLAFPEGDQRFASIESDSEDDNEDVSANNSEEGSGTGDDANAEESVEPCKGLLDDISDSGPRACILRVKEQYHFDIVGEMDSANLDFFERIRVVNHIRKLVNDGCEPSDIICDARIAMESKDVSILDNDALLTPVIKGDLVLTVLESETEVPESGTRSEDVMDALQRSLRDSNIVQ